MISFAVFYCQIDKNELHIFSSKKYRSHEYYCHDHFICGKIILGAEAMECEALWKAVNWKLYFNFVVSFIAFC